MTLVRRTPGSADTPYDADVVASGGHPHANGAVAARKSAIVSDDDGRDRIELISSVAFGLICLVLSLLMHRSPPSTLRPMPVLVFDQTVLRNPMFSEPSVEETVNDGSLILLAFVGPLIAQCAIALYICRRREDFHATICTYFVTFAICLVTTELTKIYVGRFRPNFFEQCQPNDDYTACTNPKKSAVAEARKSFPSGHASMIFCGMQLFTLYLLQRFGLRPSHTKRQRRVRRVVSILCLLPMAVALWVGVSRMVDNKHFPADVIAGALLGVGCAIFGQTLWF